MLMFNIAAYITKTIFELQLGINKITNVIEIINLAFLLSAVIIKFTIITYSSRIVKSMIDPTKFVPMVEYSNLTRIFYIFLGLSSLFYPFRIFSLMSHFKMFNPIKTFLNSVARLAPGIFIYAVVIMILLVSWT